MLDEQLHLLHDDGNVVRVPMLVKGKIVAPPKVGKDVMEKAFTEPDQTYARLPDAQVLREPIIDRATMQHTGDWQYQLLAPVQPLELIERDAETLVKGLYALPFKDVLDYLNGLVESMITHEAVLERVCELTRKTAPHPDLFHDQAFAAFPIVLSSEVARATVEKEVGIKYLDGWVTENVETFGGMTAALNEQLFGYAPPLDPPQIRAMPTRQLHITAGNAPAVPVLSLMRAIITKGAAVVKSPYGAVMPGAIVALAANAFAPDHPITKHLSLVYWRGGDAAVEDVLLAPMAFDRIVVWGAPDAVKSVQARAGFTRTIAFNPRYGLSMIGKTPDGFKKVAQKAAIDTLIWNQKACIASFVHYVEGSMADAEAYATELQDVLDQWNEKCPNYVSPQASGMLRRMKRGKYMNATWKQNVIVMDGKFDMLDHPMSRTVIVRRVDNLRDVVGTLHHGVASMTIHPEARRRELMDLCFAHGVSNVLPLGQGERTYGGMPHDGMHVLGEMVDWKHA